MNQRIIGLYLDKHLSTSVSLGGDFLPNDGDLYIGAYESRMGVHDSRFDNIQIFNKALTVEEITILALANKDAIAVQNRPSSIILFNENLVFAYDFEENSTDSWI